MRRPVTRKGRLAAIAGGAVLTAAGAASIAVAVAVRQPGMRRGCDWLRLRNRR